MLEFEKPRLQKQIFDLIPSEIPTKNYSLWDNSNIYNSLRDLELLSLALVLMLAQSTPATHHLQSNVLASYRC